MVKKTDVRTRIIEAALDCAAEGGWRDVSMADVAATAGISIADLYAEFSSRGALLNGFGRMVDARVLAGGAAAMDEPAADRLFDVLMRRFDVLNQYRDGVLSIVEASSRDPMMALCGAGQLRQSMSWMLEAAGLSSDGWRGTMRVKGLMAVYLYTLRAWMRDDSEDMAKTMAALDRALKQAGRFAAGMERGISRMPGRRKAETETDSAAEAAV
ncbi:MAG: helix-turn-helix domain-containing protein [Rhodospirillales bacterium]